MPLAAPLMQRHRIFHSRNAEETRAFLGGKGYQFDIAPRRASELDVHLNGRYTPGMYIGYVQYGRAPVEFAPGLMRNDYWIQLPLRGQLEANVGRHSIVCDPNRAAIASPAQERCRFLSEADSARIQLAFPKPALVGHLAALLGEPPDAAPDFAPALDLAAGYGQSLARYALMAAVDLDHADSMLLDPATMGLFEQMIMTGLLLSHPHSYTDALRRRERPIAPRDIKRALDYLEAHLDAPVTLADLVAASGVAGRTLLQHFRAAKGVSPIRYLRNARFGRVREALLRAGPGNSVTAIAMSWGFSHMGRFAVEYRKRFGESPSDTLRQRRSRGWSGPRARNGKDG
jgi:AraC-like DNA-binding protein